MKSDRSSLSARSLMCVVVAGMLVLQGCVPPRAMRNRESKKAEPKFVTKEVVTFHDQLVKVHGWPEEFGTDGQGRRIPTDEHVVEYEILENPVGHRLSRDEQAILRRADYRSLLEPYSWEQKIMDGEEGGKILLYPRVDGTVRVQLDPCTMMSVRTGATNTFSIAAILDASGDILAWTSAGNETVSKSGGYLTTKTRSFVMTAEEWSAARYIALSSLREEQTVKATGSKGSAAQTTTARMEDLRATAVDAIRRLEDDLVARTKWWEIIEIYQYSEEERAERLAEEQTRPSLIDSPMRIVRGGYSGSTNKGGGENRGGRGR